MVKGLVSVVIPTYMRCDSLRNSIASVLGQTYSHLEVLIVNDNDPEDQYTYDLKKLIDTISDQRLRYIEQKCHKNGAAARNVGIKCSIGEYIAFLDDDDEWEVDKLSKQVAWLERKKDIGGVSCLYSHYVNGKLISRCLPYQTDNLHKLVISRTISVSTPTLLLRKTCLDSSGYFDEDLMRHQELQLLLDFLDKFKLELVPEYLVRVNCDSSINRPDVAKMIHIKQDFFDHEKRHFMKYTNVEQRRIRNAHYFEIIHVAIKNHDFSVVIRYVAKIGLCLNAYIDVIKRYAERKKARNISRETFDGTRNK